MDLEKLKEFINFMNENNLCELEIEEEGRKIRLKKGLQENQPIIVPQEVLKKVETKEEGKKENLLEIKSPMVGTFYRAPSPTANPFVEVGSVIKPGDVICIIEAMKLMNEIKADVSGKIVQILVENGQPVEFGQTLFLLEPL